jgi:hypothetical protein
LTPAFYADSCHGLTRRRFLGGALAAAASVTVGAPVAARAGTLDETAPIIQAYATRLDDPWALVHGVRAMGRTFAAAGGQPAVAFVLSTFLEEREVNGGRYLAFPAATERHQNSFLKTFLEAGVPGELAFTAAGRRRTLQDVVEGARATFRFSETTDRNTIAWSLIALSLAARPGHGAWPNAWGERIELPAVAAAGLKALEEASRPLEDARDRGVVPERQAPIHAYTCGGTHLLYSLLVAAHTGHLATEGRRRLGRQLDLLVYRLSAEPQLIERFYRPRLDTVPGTGWYVLDARIKFIGHAFECLGYARRHGLYALPAGDAGRYDEARRLLDGEVRQLGQLGLEPVRKHDAELYQQLVGDVCHAHHGLRLL